METTHTVHMVSGEGETSYARNSALQSSEQRNMKHMIEEAVSILLNGATTASTGMAIADLGCSSGPNALVLVSTAINAVHRHCLQLQQQLPEMSIHLNDLPGNDFNLVIKNLATYKQTLENFGLVLTSIVPGSYHRRLFSKCSMHLMCSSTSLHWLSKAPEDLVSNRIPVYVCDEAKRQVRSAIVLAAYARQFEKDFTLFLRLRAEEMVPGGRMVFSMLGGRSDDNTDRSIQQLEFVASVLHEMASMGLINKDKVDSFYLPVYGPSDKELVEIIEGEGSFSIDQMKVHKPIPSVWEQATPNMRANTIRAAVEPLILQHFGVPKNIMVEFVSIAERKIQTSPQDEFPSKPRDFLAVSLTRMA